MRNDFQPVEGHRFQFRDEPLPQWDGVVDCEVLIVDPHKCLAYSWNTSTGLRTVVTWSLMPTPEGTHLRMEQSGFRPEVEANYRGAKHRWRKFIKGLERVVSNLE